MSRTFYLGHRRWLYISIDTKNTFKGSNFGRRYRDGSLFLWCGWLHLLYMPEFV